MAKIITSYFTLFFFLWSQVVVPQESVSEYSVEEISQLKGEIQQLGKFLQAYLEILPTESFEISDLSNQLPLDANSIIGWVEENVTWVPYSGVLRGADGVLMDRRGNSLDQSLLLAELLESAGYDVRIARQTFDFSEAAELAEIVSKRSLSAIPMSQLNNDEQVAMLLGERFDANPAETAADYRSFSAEQRNLLRHVQEIAENQTQYLQGALKTSVAKDPFSERAAAALRDHWWVQYKEGSDWIDIDPAMKGGFPSELTFSRSPESYYLSQEIPETLFHRVTVRVVAEKLDKGSVDEQVALEHTFVPREHASNPLTLSWVPLHSGNTYAQGDETEQDVLRTIALNEREWLPLLAHSDDAVMQSSIYADGRINTKPNLSTTTKKFSSAVEGLQGLASGPDEPSLLTAVWLEYVVHVPSQADYKARRQLFDLLGQNNRSTSHVQKPEINDSNLIDRGLALMGTTTILPSVSWLQTDFVRQLLTQNIIDNLQPLGILLDSFNDQNQISEEIVDKAIEDLNLLPAELYSYQLLRGVANPDNEYAYLDRPNLVTLHMFGEDDGSSIGFYKSIDIVSNQVASLNPNQHESWNLRLKHGVLDTIIEVLAATNAEGTFWTGFADPTNAASQLYDSMNRGEKWHAIDNANEIASLNTNHEPQVLGLVQSSVETGMIVVLPPSAYEDENYKVSTWWEIDPDTGQTLGIGPNGWGEVTLRLILHTIAKNIMSKAARRHFGAVLWCGFLASAGVVTLGLITQVPGIGPGAKDWMGSGWAKKAFYAIFRTCMDNMLFKGPKKLPGTPPKPQLPAS